MGNEIVRVRFTGPPDAVDQLLAELDEWVQLRDVSGPYPNRGSDGGVRRYAAVIVAMQEGGQ